jgi:hypothetical protein
MATKSLFRLMRLWPCIALLTFAACASTPAGMDAPAPKTVEPCFPPHEVMQTQLYSAFLMQNQEALLQCSDDSGCAIALFNLGFIYSYPKSSYYNVKKGIYYFKTLIEKYPDNSFASLAKIWIELVNRCITAESSKVQLKGRLKSKEAAIKELQKKVEGKNEEEGTEQAEQFTEGAEGSRDVEAKIDRVEREIRRKLDQSRAIDVEIERKERELVR